ncbi:DUF4157 domain-containing protein [Halobaculum sp. MBLA0147]|uniref:eCIS core domain-containing protein n=1 Tax=Halobaculum sp. MBLA0147 TaxID=3079934 RepID=UPI0035245613
METDIVGKLSIAQARERYDTEFEDDGEVRQMMRIEERWGPQVHDWIDEGVPTDAMENHLTLDRFRERRDTPIPWNVEKRNKKSLQRSREATEEIEPAGRTSVPDAVREVISSPGRPLDASIQRAVEERMDDSLGDVRIHTGPRAAAAADAIDARAFTVGNHVVFGAGEYDPESAEGQHVLAHELAHVRQQTGGALSMLPQDDVQLEIDPDPELEREAEETAQRVMSGGDLGIQRLSDTDVHVQRIEEDQVFDAMALFEAEVENETGSEFRRSQNQNRLGYLSDVADDVLTKQNKQSAHSTKRELEESSYSGAEVISEGLQREIDQLSDSISEDLSDVGLTEDQRAVLSGDLVTDQWDDVAWTTVKALLSATSLGTYITVSQVLSKATGHDPDSIGKQAVGRVRRGEIHGWEDIRAIWERTNGSLQQRAERIEQEVRNDDYESPEREGVSEPRRK